MGLTQLKCPVCKKEVAADDPNMPFCSDRCRMVDLGNWASDKYVISRPIEPGEIEGTEDFEADEGPVQ